MVLLTAETREHTEGAQRVECHLSLCVSSAVSLVSAVNHSCHTLNYNPVPLTHPSFDKANLH
jgi:hypothetical protein